MIRLCSSRLESRHPTDIRVAMKGTYILKMSSKIGSSAKLARSIAETANQSLSNHCWRQHIAFDFVKPTLDYEQLGYLPQSC